MIAMMRRNAFMWLSNPIGTQQRNTLLFDAEC
jgi:hypothetical protein